MGMNGISSAGQALSTIVRVGAQTVLCLIRVAAQGSQLLLRVAAQAAVRMRILMTAAGESRQAGAVAARGTENAYPQDRLATV